MYIRVVKSKGYSYARLVDSFRDPDTGKVKQRVVANLCRLDPPDPKANALKAFFQQDSDYGHLQEDIVLESSKDFGHVVFLHEIWLELGVRPSVNLSFECVATRCHQNRKTDSVDGVLSNLRADQ